MADKAGTHGAHGVTLGRDVVVHPSANIYGCAVGDETRIAAFVEVQMGAVIGARCKISSHAFICDGVTIGDEVFIGHHVCFTNDAFPRATTSDGRLQGPTDWVCQPTVVLKGASIGSGSVILPGITIGAEAMVGAGSVVVSEVPDRAVVAGNPARILRLLAEPPSGS